MNLVIDFIFSDMVAGEMGLEGSSRNMRRGTVFGREFILVYL